MARKRRALAVDYVFDIETEEWSQFVCGVLYDVELNRPHVYHWEREAEFAEHLLSLRGVLWAYNGGRFDALWLLRWIYAQFRDGRYEAEPEIFASSARITNIRIDKRLEIRDMQAIVGPSMSLAKAAKLAGAEKTETGLACVCGRQCGGYCAIRRDAPMAERERLAGYCVNDCVVTAKVGLELLRRAELNDIDIRGTIGASAWATARRKFDIPGAEWTPRQYRLAREGYKGGRTQVFKPRSAAGWRYDINSAYPGALRDTPLPMGKPYELAGEDARAELADGRPGVYRALVQVPDMHLPPLPWKDPADRTGRTQYPIGTFRGAWTGTELTYAMSVGVRVLAVGQSILWPYAERIMAPMMEWGWALRAADGKGHPYASWMKGLLNSLTGKFAQRPVIDVHRMSSEPVKPCAGGNHCGGIRCGAPDVGCCDHRCTGHCGPRPVGRMTGIVVSREWRLPDNGHVAWAAHLTAAPRIKWHRVASQLPIEAIAYCDTDCLYTELPIPDSEIGPGLNQWLCEGTYQDFVAFAPKTYGYLDEKGERIIRAKGIPRAKWEAILARDSIVVDSGVEQFRTALRSGEFFRRKSLTRRLKYDGIHYGDRVIGSDGLTHPPLIECAR